ncbi:MAG: urea carboxylase-associated family protein [Vulcanimicrobiaceae bacterium]
MATSHDGLTPQAYRARYDDLMRDARSHATAFTVPSGDRIVHALPEEAIVERATVPAGWYWTGVVRRGRTLRVVNASGTPGVSAFFWNAKEPSERYCMGDTVKIQWTVKPDAGRLLLSDMGRVLFSIVADTDGAHDPLLGGTMREPNDPPHARNARDNFILAAAKHGLGKRDIAPCVTFFAAIDTDDAGAFRWSHAPAAGSTVDLRAEMDVLVALSNTPHPLAPSRVAAGPIEATIWAAAPATAQDRCRTATVEARRAFENTDAVARA